MVTNTMVCPTCEQRPTHMERCDHCHGTGRITLSDPPSPMDGWPRLTDEQIEAIRK